MRIRVLAASSIVAPLCAFTNEILESGIEWVPHPRRWLSFSPTTKPVELRSFYPGADSVRSWGRSAAVAGPYCRLLSGIMFVMGIDESLTREIVRRLLGVTKPDRIILFGSAATGTMSRDSDIDLLVVSRVPVNTIEEHVRLRRSLRGLGFPFDVFIIGTDWFEESKDIFGGIAYPAHKYGRVIYEAA